MTALPPMPDTVQVKACCGLMLNEPCDCAPFQTAVYVIAVGERSEGHSPIRVESTLVGALAWATETYGVTAPSRDRDNPDRWMASIGVPDELWIYRMAVQ